jgi:hypothetical protein
MAFKVVNYVTLPLFKLNENTRHLRFDVPYYVGKVVDDKKEPPTMCKVTDMETGELGEIILGQILKEKLAEHYPDNGYVGKIFAISKSAPEGSRKYSLFHIAEVQDEPEVEQSDLSGVTASIVDDEGAVKGKRSKAA